MLVTRGIFASRTYGCGDCGSVRRQRRISSRLTAPSGARRNNHRICSFVFSPDWCHVIGGAREPRRRPCSQFLPESLLHEVKRNFPRRRGSSGESRPIVYLPCLINAPVETKILIYCRDGVMLKVQCASPPPPSPQLVFQTSN